MENSFLNVSVRKRMFTVINKFTNVKYQFISNNEIKNKKITKDKESYINDILDKYNVKETISDKSIIIDDWLNEDDTIQMVLNKIGIYCGNTIGNCVYAWYKGKPLAFSYKDNIKIEKLDENTKPDDNFYRDDIFNTGIYVNRNFNELLQSIEDLDDTIYFITLEDFMEKNKSDDNTYFNGIIRKYWINITDINFIKNFDIKSKVSDTKNNIKRISQQISLIENSYIDYDEILDETFTLSLLKLSTKIVNDNEVNIIKIFSDIRLSESIPSSKLILDEFDDSYYKIFKDNIVNKSITKETCKAWIHDSKVNIKEVPYFKYIYPTNVVVFYLYINNVYILLIINKNSEINIIIKNDTNEIDRKILMDIINNVNDFIKTTINKHTMYSNHHLNYFDNLNDTELLEGELSIPDDDYKLKEIHQFFKNLFGFVRIVDEVKSKSETVMRYKRVNNYDNMSVLESVISTLKNPKINLPENEICETISKSFNISMDDAEKELKEWKETTGGKLVENENLNIFTISTSEPGTQIIITKTTNDVKFKINDCTNILEFNDILILLKTTIILYKKFKSDDLDRNTSNYFTKQLSYVNKLHDDRVNNPTISTLNTNLVLDSSSEDSEDEIDMSPSISVTLGTSIATSPNITSINPDDTSTDSSSDSSINPDDTSTDSSSSEGGGKQSGGAGYYITRINDMDKQLVKNYNKRVVNKSEEYIKKCGTKYDRMPIVVDDNELKRIDESEDKGSGKLSYGASITTGSSSDKQFNYICPKYWDIGQKLSLDPNQKDKLWDSSKIIKKTTKDTKEGIIARTDNYWKNAKDIYDYQPRKMGENFPDDSNMICCSLKKTEKEGVVQNKISKTLTCGENKYCNIDNTLKNLFRQEDNFLYDGTSDTDDLNLYSSGKSNPRKLYKSGFARKGLYNSTIIGCLSTIHDNKDLYKIDIFNKKFVEYLQNNINKIQTKYLRENIDKYIVESLKEFVHKTILNFKLNDYKKYIYDVLSNKYDKIDVKEKESDMDSIYNSVFLLIKGYINKLKSDIFINFIIDKLKENIDVYIYSANGLLFDTFKPNKHDNEMFNSYIDFLKTYKSHFDITESIINDLKYETLMDDLKDMDYKYKYLFDLSNSFNNYCDYLQSDIYKDDKYILPIISDILPEFNNTSFIVFEYINGDTRIKVPIDNFSNLTTKVSFIYKNEQIYESIVFRNNIGDYYGTIEKSTNNIYITNVITNVIQLCRHSIHKKPNILSYTDVKANKVYLNTHNRISHIVTENNDIIPIDPSGILKGDVDKYIFDFNFELNTYKETIKYMKKIKYVPIGIIVEKDNVVNIIFSNNSYVPVKSEKYDRKKHKYNIAGTIDLFTLDKSLSYNDKHVDERIEFTNQYNYEMQINTIFNCNLLVYIKEHDEMREDLHKIITNEIQINKLKRNLLYELIYKHIKNIVKIVDKDEMKEYIDRNICYNNTKSNCNDPCVFTGTSSIDRKYSSDDSDVSITSSQEDAPGVFGVEKCLLKIQKKSEITDSDMLDKFIQKFIELLLIHGVNKSDKHNIFYSVNYKIEPFELRTMTPPTEYFFTYIQYIDSYLDILFDVENMFIYNDKLLDETIYERNMIEHNSISMFEISSPIIVQKVFGESSKINKYDSNENIDSRIIYDTIADINNSTIDSFDIQNNMNKGDTLENLNNLAKELSLGFIYITKKYSKVENRYEVYFILDNVSEFTDDELYIVLLVDIVDDNKEYLTNIIYKNNSAFLKSELRDMKTLKEYCKDNKLISGVDVNKVIFE